MVERRMKKKSSSVMHTLAHLHAHPGTRTCAREGVWRGTNTSCRETFPADSVQLSIAGRHVGHRGLVAVHGHRQAPCSPAVRVDGSPRLSGVRQAAEARARRQRPATCAAGRPHPFPPPPLAASVGHPPQNFSLFSMEIDLAGLFCLGYIYPLPEGGSAVVGRSEAF